MSGRMSGAPDEFVLFNGRLHVVNAAYILLGLSLALSLTATPFFPGVAKFVAAVVVVAVHLAILLGVFKRIALLLHSFMGLLAVLYVTGLIFVLVMFLYEVFQTRRGSYKLYQLHLASFSALMTNIFAPLLYVMFKVVKFISASPSYDNLQDDMS